VTRQSVEIDYKPRIANLDLPTRSKDEMGAIALPSVPGLSPTKPNGILMTPGTTRRNKTVSFGAQVFDKEKNQGTTGISSTSLGDGLAQAASTANRAPTKLTAQLQEVRNSAQKAKANQMPRAKDDTDLTMDYLEPRSQSGKYWKKEYESYAENTQREMKKLVIKQKAAKDYAKEKDQEVADLQAQLRQQRLKVEKLEAKTKELAVQMKEFERTMMGQTNQDTQRDMARFKKENEHLRHDLDQVLGKKSGIANSPKRKTPRAAPPGDLWANAAFSSPFVNDAADRDQSPLRARDMNIQGQTPKDGKPRGVKSVHTKSLSEDMMDMSLPLPSPESMSRTTPRSSRKSTADMTIDELVEKYSPEKPQFNRLALPLGVGTLNFGSSKPDMKPTANLPKTGAKIASLSDERLAQAKARIEARKMSKLAAA
jgi:predicted  nucleic acid-binding Zn-ribbon protein